MKKWKTISSDYIYKTPFGNLRNDRCELPNGEKIVNYYVHEYSNWVNAAVLTKDNKVVLVEQYRHPGNDCFLEIPAGKIEGNETFEEGIIREVREETGFISDEKPILLGEFMVNPATQDNKVITFLFLEAYPAFPQNLDVGEEVSIKIVNFNDMENMIKTKKITQLFTVSAYYMAKNYLTTRLNVK